MRNLYSNEGRMRLDLTFLAIIVRGDKLQSDCKDCQRKCYTIDIIGRNTIITALNLRNTNSMKNCV